MVFEAHSDHGTVLKQSESALVVDDEGEVHLLLACDDDDDLPRMTVLLASVLSKISDDEWVEELIEEFIDAAEED